MYSALLFIKKQLTDNIVITAQIPADNMYPLVASAKVDAEDFVVFNVQRSGNFTKDIQQSYTSEIQVFGSDILEAAQKADIIELELTNHNLIRSTFASVELTEDLERAYIKILFTFKI